MPTLAGQMTTTAQAGTQWVVCDGRPHYALYAKQPVQTHAGISQGTRQDYLRQVGWQGRRRGLGPLGWIFCVPYDSTGTFKVSTADNSTETTLTPPVATVAKPLNSGVK